MMTYYGRDDFPGILLSIVVMLEKVKAAGRCIELNHLFVSSQEYHGVK